MTLDTNTVTENPSLKFDLLSVLYSFGMAEEEDYTWDTETSTLTYDEDSNDELATHIS